MIKNIHIIALLALVSGCTSIPNQVALSPLLEAPADQINNIDTITSIRSVDKRNQQFMITIKKEDQEQVKIVSSATNLRQSIQQALIQGWNEMGIGFVDAAPSSVLVEIMELSTQITQKKLSYQGECNMRVLVTIKTPTSLLTKEYSSRQTSNGNFKANIDKEAQRMDQQLNTLLEQILIDSQLIGAMNYDS